jgi:uncharacterized NAD-dependent epimerase/dehydratase family protein
MAVGKMSACLELLAAARRRGLDARFIGTGQAGLLISGQGVPLDAVRVDYAAGAVEQAVLAAAAPADAAGSRDAAGPAGPAGPDTWLLVEGQGSLCHPGSTATLPLLRGSQPTDLLLVHRAGQTSIRNHAEVAMPPLREVIEAVERLAALGRPAAAASAPMPAPRVRAIALNTAHLDEPAAQRALFATAASTGLPCTDPVRQGGEGLWQVLLGE